MAKILGISAFYHDSAAALVADGRILSAAQEERFSRKKHDESFPQSAIKFCLESSGISGGEIDHVIFYEKPFLKFERLVETYLTFSPRGFSSFRKAMPAWLSKKLFQKSEILEFLKEIDEKIEWKEKILFSEHHLSHAASAFYPSPFEEAIVLTMDGVGEHATTSVAIGKGKDLQVEKEIHFPHSLGLLYSAFTYFLGFKVNSGEYKVMGLAPYGRPIFKNLILSELVDLKDDGSFRLDLRYFDYCVGNTMTNQNFTKLFRIKRRNANDPLEQVHMDVAASVQAVTEEVILRLANSLRREFNIPNLCLAGGVALNCVANGKILKEAMFDDVWVQPAAGDAGGAVGAAYVAEHLHLGNPRKVMKPDSMSGAFLGPNFSTGDVENRLKNLGARLQVVSDEELIETTARALAQGSIVGWHQGKMEFGPRALGARSILADARSEKMQSTLNLKIKYRESFRPFAPVVLREKLEEWFDLDRDSPYMLFVAEVKDEHRKEVNSKENLFGVELLKIPRSNVPAITHVDFSARVQTVHPETNPKMHLLLEKFFQLTNTPILVNTSFNVRGEPIVCTPEDSFRCFMETEMDLLVIENCILRKAEQPPDLKENYRTNLDLD